MRTTGLLSGIFGLVIILAGCTSGPSQDGDEQPVGAPPAVVIRDHTFEVMSMGAVTQVAATIYAHQEGSERAVLAVHGSAGVRGNNWGPLPVPGYSLGMRVAANGTDFVAIDLPGYGDSPPPGEVETFEGYVRVVDQLATQLRTGGVGKAYERIVGLGHSMGGAIIDEAQSTYGSFDAIAVTGWAHSGFSDEFNSCFAGPTPCPERVDQFFDAEHMDETVLDSMMATFEGAHVTANLGNFYWGLRPGGADMQGHQELITARIDVPVLIVLGATDWHWNARDYDKEGSFYPNAATFDLIIVPDAGHFQFHHLNHAETQGGFVDWLGPSVEHLVAADPSAPSGLPGR